MQLLITEVTDMSRGMHCVAGIELNTYRTIRPLTAQGRHWSGDIVSTIGIRPTAVIDFPGLVAKSNRGLPHSREDHWTSGDAKFVRNVSTAKAIELCRKAVNKGPEDLFGDELVESKWVNPGTDCPSLGCIAVNPKKCRLYFNEDHGKAQVRLWFVLGANRTYSYKVTATEIQGIASSAGETGVKKIESKLKAAATVIVRLGLAHAWKGPENEEFETPRCYVQANGLLYE